MAGTSNLDDDVLAELARQGSSAAFSVLVKRHQEAVYVIAQNMFASPHDAVEVMQQTFLSLHGDPGLERKTATFGTRLYRIAMKTALARRLRDRCSQPCPLESFLPRFDGDGHLVPSTSRWPEPDNSSLERMEVTAVLRQALEFLDDRTRAAFILRDVLELPVDEAATVLETSSKDIRRRAHRARLMLRGLLDRMV